MIKIWKPRKIENNITIKLFLMLSASFIVFAMILILIQLFIVGRMYYTTSYTAAKVKSLSTAIEKIKSDYYMNYYRNLDSKKENALLQKYSSAYKAYFIILDDKCKLKYVPSPAKKDLGSYYLSRTANQICNSNSISNSTGMRITGFFGLPSKYLAVYEKTDRIMLAGTATKKIQFLLGIKSMYPSVYIAAVTAEANTSKNISVLKSYVTYVLILGIIISVFLAAFFSLIITRPIVRIKNVAAKMVNLDFNEKCSVKSTDEIGVLAKTLNFLSERLDKSLTELNKANKKLKSDLDIQRGVDNMRKEFIASVSHEFKTPLTLIRGYTEGIQGHLINESDYDEAQNIVIGEVDKMDRLVQELLELSTLDSPCYSLRKSHFVIDDLLRDVENSYSIIMKKRGIKFTVSTACDNIKVTADRFRLEQVISNFLNNALANTAAGGFIILKSCLENNLVRLSVINEGLNIDEADIERIWDSFYRSDKSRSKKTGGSGLGLAICKAILEKHGVQYGVKNKKNCVEFYFLLNSYEHLTDLSKKVRDYDQ